VDFFREQDVARRNARLLTLLFVAAVMALILLTNMLLAGFLILDSGSGASHGQQTMLRWRSFLQVGGVITAIIGAVVMVNWINFARGGQQIASALGGRLIQPGTDDPMERRASNIVQEMALAANMPVPPIYILDEEQGINAFAAGTQHSNAVVAVTRGALNTLTRDELQGVIGHEFSHILNGDMRLSIRLAAMLRGITFIGDVGSLLLRSASRQRSSSSSKNDGRAVALVMGLGLYVIGLLGGLMAGLIKSAISKQKEYLADASSVQFTRNPDGIGDALKVIGGHSAGTFVETARAEELSHLFFGQVKHRLWSGFATHPPIEKRIRRVDPDWDGQFTDVTQRRASTDLTADEKRTAAEFPQSAGVASIAAVTGAVNAITAARPDPNAVAETSLAATLIADTRDPFGAMALLLALVWEPTHAATQSQLIEDSGIRGLLAATQQSSEAVRALDAGRRLQMIELCLPALRGLSAPQYTRFRALLLGLISADGKTRLEEWCLFQMVRHYLDPEFMRVRPTKPRHSELRAVRGPLATALGTLAHLTEQDTARAFSRGADTLGLALALPATESLDVQTFSEAVTTLADCYPLLKVSILKAMAAVARDDGMVSGAELALVKAMAMVMDCPVPDKLLAQYQISEHP